MKWEHVCSLEWMKARQQYLCASEVKQLIPFTKTGRSRTITDVDRMKILANKVKTLTTDDCISTGAAARGHMLEPFAIDELNAYFASEGISLVLWHWDDVVVHAYPYTTLAYSPDALNNEPPGIGVSEVIRSGANVLGEVKSYSPERHLEALCTPKDKLEERWQLATAMAADSDLCSAWLIFYNPSLSADGIGIFNYDRADLAKEIQIVLDVEKKWADFIKYSMGSTISHGGAVSILNPSLDEAAIIEKIEAESKMMP